MSLIKNIKNKAGIHYLKKKAQTISRLVQVCNYASATKVGLLYQAEEKNDYLKVTQWVQYLKEEQGIRWVKAMAYHPAKEVPDFLSAASGPNFFTKNELNWHMRPRGHSVANFEKEPFDILIDLTTTDVLPLQYLLVCSKATFKVGFFREHMTPYYDLMMAMENGHSQEEFIRQTNHFLQTLNNEIKPCKIN